MKEFFIDLFKRMWKAVAIITLMTAISLFPQGELNLLGGMFIGYLLGGFYFISVAGRLNRIMLLIRNPIQARREMIIGLLLRMLMIFLCLMLTIKISTRIFFMTALGFFVVFLIGLFYISKISWENRIGRR